MTIKEHRKRHKLLHENLDELLADFLRITGGPVLNRPILDLMKWSAQQTKEPDHGEP